MILSWNLFYMEWLQDQAMRDYLFNLAFVEIQGTPKLSELAWVDLMLKGRPSPGHIWPHSRLQHLTIIIVHGCIYCMQYKLKYF